MKRRTRNITVVVIICSAMFLVTQPTTAQSEPDCGTIHKQINDQVDRMPDVGERMGRTRERIDRNEAVDTNKHTLETDTSTVQKIKLNIDNLMAKMVGAGKDCMAVRRQINDQVDRIPEIAERMGRTSERIDRNEAVGTNKHTLETDTSTINKIEVNIDKLLTKLSACCPTRQTEAPPPPAEDCDPAITKISDLVDQFATTSESVGTVKQRIADSELAKDTPPEEKKAALEADNAILKDKQQLALKLRGDIQDAWKDFTRNRPCANSAQQLRRLLDDLEDKSQRIGRFQELLDRHIGFVEPKGLDAERNEAKSILNEIKDILAGCCAKKSPLELNTIGIGPIVRPTVGPNTMNMRVTPILEMSVGYQFERAPDEQAKNLNGINGQVFYDFAQHIGIGADFAWTTGSDRLGITTDVTQHRFTGLVGPQIKSKLFFFGPIEHNRDKGLSEGRGIVLSFQPLFGFVHDSTKFQSSTLSTSSASTAFMMSFGANLDVMIKKNFGIRAFDFAYQPTHFGGEWQSNWKLGAGIVFRFGKEKELPTW